MAPFISRYALGLAVLALLAAPASARAQFPPDSFTNLEVLPADIEARELVGLMVGFTRALGVRCSDCHMGEEGQPLAEYDFAADDKALKRKARAMLRMVEEINGEHLAGLEERVDPPLRVECATCHRGVREPRMLQDILLSAYEDAGLDAAAATYDSLRAEYYGRFAYDFGDVVLSDVAAEIEAAGRLEDAVRLHALNVERNPGSLLARRLHVRAALLHAFRADGPEGGTATYRELRARHPDDAFPELLLNGVGYALLKTGRTDEAIRLFELNVEAYPGSFNVYDSLGEAYMVAGKDERAIANYEKSLELNPENTNAVEKLKELRDR